jgi:hypothetical protein
MGVLIKDVWHKEVLTVALRNAVQPRRWGMTFTVTNDATSANNTTWVLVRGLSDTNKNNNSNWQTLADYVGGGSALNREYFSGDGSDTTFVVSQTPESVLLVEVGGQILEPTTDYTLSGSTFTLATAPATGQRIGIYYFTAVSSSTDFLESASADTSGATITLDMTDLKQRMFVGSASFATAKAMALSNNSNALVFQFAFQISNVAATLTWPAGFTMQSDDTRWNSGTRVWTAAAIGKYEASATYDGTEWKLKISAPFS